MTDLDDLTRELASIQDQLLALPADAYAERYSLEKRRDQLRSDAATFRDDLDGDRPDADLLRELKALRGQLSALEGQRIDLVVQSGGGSASGTGSDGLGGFALNQAVDQAQGLDKVRARISHVVQQLERRGVDVSPA